MPFCGLLFPFVSNMSGGEVDESYAFVDEEQRQKDQKRAEESLRAADAAEESATLISAAAAASAAADTLRKGPRSAATAAAAGVVPPAVDVNEFLPNFELPSTEGLISIHDLIDGCVAVLFTYAHDFDPVATTVRWPR